MTPCERVTLAASELRDDEARAVPAARRGPAGAGAVEPLEDPRARPTAAPTASRIANTPTTNFERRDAARANGNGFLIT